MWISAGLGAEAVDVGLDCLLLLAEPAAFVLAGFALGVVLGLADRLADDVRLRDSSSTSACSLRRCDLELHEPADVDLHAAAVAVLLNELGFSRMNRLSSMRANLRFTYCLPQRHRGHEKSYHESERNTSV